MQGLLRSTMQTPIERIGHRLAYDAARRRRVVMGGNQCNLIGGSFCLGYLLADTWEYDVSTPAWYTPFGSGCAGTAGLPVLASAPLQLPWIGTSVEVRVQPIPPGAPTVMILGSSKSVFAGGSLPLGLGFLGMTGCSLLVSPDVVVPMASREGAATLTLTIPASAALAGSAFHDQALIVDPGANAAGLIVSNGQEAAIGSNVIGKKKSYNPVTRITFGMWLFCRWWCFDPVAGSEHCYAQSG